MIDTSAPCPPRDVHLLLRAHAQQHWLRHEVVPVLRELERPDSVPAEQLAAALAYLEVHWIAASRLAAETDAACVELDASCAQLDSASAWDRALRQAIRRYHQAVRALHDSIARPVAELVASPRDAFTFGRVRF